MYSIEDLPLDLVGDMFAFLGGNVVGYIAEDQAIQTGNAWFSPDPVTNGRYVNLALVYPPPPSVYWVSCGAPGT